MVQIDISDTSYSYDELQKPSFQKLSDQVRSMRAHGSLSPASHHRVRKYFRIKNIYRSVEKSARYLFFFGTGSSALRRHCGVTLHLAREEPENSYNYERLDSLDMPNVPDVVETGYEMSKERFVVRRRNGRALICRVEEFGKQFFEDVVDKHLGTRLRIFTAAR